MELNMPRSGIGFTTRFPSGKSRRSSSALTARSLAAKTAAICPARNASHCAIKCPSTEVPCHGNSNFGCPMRDEAPAARMTTPKSSTARPTTSPLSSIVISRRLASTARIERKVARASRPCVSCTIRTGGTPVPLPQPSPDGGAGVSLAAGNLLLWLQCGAPLNELSHHADGNLRHADGLDVETDRAGDFRQLIFRRDPVLNELLENQPPFAF